MSKFTFNGPQLWIFAFTCMLYGIAVAFNLWIPVIILAVVLAAIVIWVG